MADDGPQVPMFPREERDALLLEVVRLQAKAIADLTQRDSRPATLHALRKEPHRYMPQDKKLRDWAAFRQYMQELEHAYRKDHNLGPADYVSKAHLYAQGGPNPRTLTRVMTQTHGLKARDWPPSTWPERLPRDSS